MDKIKRQNIYAPSDSGIAFMLAIFVPQVLIVLVLVLFGKQVATSTLASALVPQISFLLTFVYVSEKRKVNYKKANQINFAINPWVLLVVLLIGVVSMLGFSPLISVFDTVTTSWGYKSSIANIDVTSFLKFFGAVFYVALLPAVCEELIFRGIVTNGLKKYGTTTAVVISSIFFALMHQNLQQLIYQLFLGAVMAYIVLKTGSIIYTMCLHFFNNFAILLLSHLNVNIFDGLDYSKPLVIVLSVALAIATIGIVCLLLWAVNGIISHKQKLQNSIADSSKSVDIKSATTISAKSESSADAKGVNENVQLSSALIRADQTDKFYKNAFVVSALVVGIIMWVASVIVAFN